MPVKPDPVIARIHAPKAHLKGRAADIDDVTLFFPHNSANPGMVMSWQRVGQHGDASLEYLTDTCRPAKGDAEANAVAAALAKYGQENPDFPMVEVQRLPNGWREMAWGHRKVVIA